MEEDREQPIEEQANTLNKVEDCGAVSEIGSQKNDIEKSEWGKFKSPEALLDAYNSLEKEFTKKCQKLSEYEKDKIEKDKIQIAENEINSEEFEENFSKFLSQNADAVGYSEEIRELVNEDKEIKSLKNPFEVAWFKVFSNHVLKKPQADDYVLNKYVLSNQDIQNKIVEDYLKKLKDQKIPVVISSSSGERVSSIKPDTPSTLEEAKKLVDKMFR